MTHPARRMRDVTRWISEPFPIAAERA